MLEIKFPAFGFKFLSNFFLLSGLVKLSFSINLFTFSLWSDIS